MALVEASGASLARTGPQTVVVAGEATIIEGERAVDDASRIIRERLDRLAAGMASREARTPSEGSGEPLTLERGSDGTWSA